MIRSVSKAGRLFRTYQNPPTWPFCHRKYRRLTFPAMYPVQDRWSEGHYWTLHIALKNCSIIIILPYEKLTVTYPFWSSCCNLLHHFRGQVDRVPHSSNHSLLCVPEYKKWFCLRYYSFLQNSIINIENANRIYRKKRGADIRSPFSLPKHPIISHNFPLVRLCRIVLKIHTDTKNPLKIKSFLDFQGPFLWCARGESNPHVRSGH